MDRSSCQGILTNGRHQASSAKWKRTALFWAIMQRVVVIPYRRVGKIGRIGCPETSVGNRHHTLGKSPKESSSQS